MYLLSQIIRFISCSFGIASDYQNNKKRLYTLNGISNLLQGLSYFMIGAFTGGVISILATFRNIFIYLYKGKNIVLYFILFSFISIVTSYAGIKNIFDLLPLIIGILYTASLFINNMKVIKISIIIVDILNIIYDIYYFSIVGIIFTLASLILTILSEIEYYSKKDIQQESLNIE